MFENRNRTVGLVIVTALVIIWGRVAYLQLALGPWYRASFVGGEVRTRQFPAPRGTIRSADGLELALDRCDADLAVHYRYLERPADESWLTRQALSRLSRRQRRDPERLKQSKQELIAEIRFMWRSVAELTDTSEEELERRAAVVQRRVERIVESVNRRQRERWEREKENSQNQTGESNTADIRLDSANWGSSFRRLCEWLSNNPPQSPSELVPITVVEQNQYHTLVENLSADSLLELTANPERYPGVELNQKIRRVYPQRESACAVVGYVEPRRDETAEEIDLLESGVGRSGLEGFYESQLRGIPGQIREQVITGGLVARVLGGRAPQPGRAITLTLDWRLQRFAEELLERELRKAASLPESPGRLSSGAAIVMDVRTGAVLVAASVPRFDLNIAAQPNSAAAIQLAQQQDSPLFNRVVQMALPPGSVFKPVTAVAALQKGFDPQEPYFCRGYLRDPDSFRCLIYRHFGVGHESVRLHEALVRSCNVYFFRVSERIGWEEIVRWGEAFGFGSKTGIDLAEEESGMLPAHERNSRGQWGTPEGEMKSLAIGQGPLLATPVQVAVMMAAIANDGYRVVPHVRRDSFQPPRPVAGLEPHLDRSLLLVRRALEQVVADSRGTGHEHVFLLSIAIAGKTGTAQSGSPRGDHAWFAGYVPAGDPKFALVVVLEHAGAGGIAAGPVAREIVLEMLDRGVFSVPPDIAGGKDLESESTRH